MKNYSQRMQQQMRTQRRRQGGACYLRNEQQRREQQQRNQPYPVTFPLRKGVHLSGQTKPRRCQQFQALPPEAESGCLGQVMLILAAGFLLSGLFF